MHACDSWFVRSVLVLAVLAVPSPAQRSASRRPPAEPNVHGGGSQVLGPGAVVARRLISSDDGLPDDSLDGSDLFGQALARLGDLDGDGLDELAVGIQDFESNGGLFAGLSIEGAVLILSLRNDGEVARFQRIDNHSPGFAGALGVGDRFGAALAPLGDLDGDGVPDMAAGTGMDCGNCEALYVLFLNADGSVKSFVRHPGLPPFSLASLGDLDGDGAPELVLGEREDPPSSRGAVEILFLAPDGSVHARRKIDETQGGFTGGLAAQAQFGSSVAGLGDLDGDGVEDMAVGASGNGGVVWTLFLRADGTVRAHARSVPVPGLGEALAVLGDQDGNGVVDLAAGDPSDDDGGSERGATWILFLAADGTVAATRKISDLAGGFGGELADFDRFGSAVAGLGDLDGDGSADLAVGAPFDDDNQNASGSAWILFLAADGTVHGEAKISDRAGSLESTLDPADEFGRSAALLGDMDGDGLPEWAVGASFDDDGGPDRGAVWILFPDASGRAKRMQKISGTHGGLGAPLGDGHRFGMAVEGLGDLDGDGVEDLAVGAPHDGRGSVWILFLEPEGTVKSAREIANAQGGFGGGLTSQARFGSGLARLGDLDGDGTLELAVGAPQQDETAVDDGALWVLSLDALGAVQAQRKIASGAGAFTGVLQARDGFGASLEPLDDIEGDGVVDLAVGAVREEEQLFSAEYGSGSVWILFLEPDGTVKGHVEIDEGEGGFTGDLVAEDVFARSLAALGDLDGDGVTELAVGAPRDTQGELGPKGAVWVLFLGADGRVKTHSKIRDDVGLGGQLDPNANFGCALAALGDQDGDGVPDLLAGTRHAWAGGNQGALWLLALDGIATVGFERGDDPLAAPLANGLSLASSPAFSRSLTLTSSGANLGAAVFDSTPLGPNDPSQDRDLLVGKGNLLILQDSFVSTQTQPGIFDRPNDDANGGVLAFQLARPSAALALDLVDIDPGQNQSSSVHLFDAAGRSRSFAVPAGWTEDLRTHGPPAWRTLDLTTLAPQPGYVATATASELPGFDPLAVVRIEVRLGSSGAVDDVQFDPHPGH